MLHDFCQSEEMNSLRNEVCNAHSSKEHYHLRVPQAPESDATSCAFNSDQLEMHVGYAAHLVIGSCCAASCLCQTCMWAPECQTESVSVERRAQLRQEVAGIITSNVAGVRRLAPSG